MASKIIPRFEEIVDNLGFDKDATPRWQMIGTTETRSVLLRNGAGLFVQSRNERIASIKEDYAGASAMSRMFEIKGESPGVTFIEVMLPNLPIVQRLEVHVKDKLPLKIAFQFVEDGLFDKTKRPTIPNFMYQLRYNLNNIFELQAAITLDITREKDVRVNTTLNDIIGRQDKYDLAYGSGWNGPYKEMDKLTAEGDPKANINIFFLPRSPDTPPSLMFGADGNIICVDDGGATSIETTERALGHWIGLMLGCPEAPDRRHLMFRSPPDYDGGRFISKDVANFMYSILTP